jgi:hypothetical protein
MASCVRSNHEAFYCNNSSRTTNNVLERVINHAEPTHWVMPWESPAIPSIHARYVSLSQCSKTHGSTRASAQRVGESCSNRRVAIRTGCKFHMQQSRSCKPQGYAPISLSISSYLCCSSSLACCCCCCCGCGVCVCVCWLVGVEQACISLLFHHHSSRFCSIAWCYTTAVGTDALVADLLLCCWSVASPQAPLSHTLSPISFLFFRCCCDHDAATNTR